MKALLCKTLGPAENLVLEDIEPEALGPAAVRVRVDRAEAVEHAEAGVRLVHRRVRVERGDDAPPGHQRRRDDHQPAPRRQPARRAPGRPAARRRQHRVHKVVAVDVGVQRRRQRRLHPQWKACRS